ncbi:DUF397 domain-containing protein [Actinokineospora sp. HBU206404]|uniref:DUF397 domain-containing protein n=1 Tax=Actinokineospora xionganensis TaxID=2684470 RepID=A0ABR7L6F6_9PSEU|nr:DUF397 domain-containing protein [Actinokineospora xionganensis]
MAFVYRRSSFCSSGSCVEVAVARTGSSLRDRGCRALALRADTWSRLLSWVRGGHWDRTRGGGSPV